MTEADHGASEPFKVNLGGALLRVTLLVTTRHCIKYN